MDEAQDNYDAYVARRQKANELATIQDKDRYACCMEYTSTVIAELKCCVGSCG